MPKLWLRLKQNILSKLTQLQCRVAIFFKKKIILSFLLFSFLMFKSSVNNNNKMSHATNFCSGLLQHDSTAGNVKWPQGGVWIKDL